MISLNSAMPKLCFSLLVFSLVGCVTRGQNFSSDTSWLDQTRPSQGQVQKIMGPPYKIGSSNGIPTWTYGYYKHQLFGESSIKELKIYWDKSGAVKTYSFSSSFKKDTRKASKH